jgi:hypothetical protein
MGGKRILHDRYILIRHSAWRVSKKPAFKQAVELMSVKPSAAARAKEAGGLVFHSFREAFDAEHLVNYPADHPGGLIPQAKGGFVRFRMDNMMLDLYVPTTPDSKTENES